MLKSVAGLVAPLRDGLAALSGQRQKASLRDIVEVSGDWFWEMDADLRFSYISEGFFETFGLAPEQIIGKTRFEVASYDPESEHWRKHRENLESRKQFRDFEFDFATRGEICHVRISGKPVFDRKGSFIGYVGMGTDKTAEVKARRALEASEKQFRNLIEGSIQGIFIHDDWDILFANQSLADCLGYSCHLEVLDLVRVENVIAPEEVERLRGYHTARRTGKFAPAAYEVQCVRKDGSKVWCEFRTTPTMWQGKPTFQCMVADISERKAAQEALQKQNAMLLRRDKQLVDQNERFNAALANMSQGICLFDADQRLIVSNQRYAEIYGLDPELLQPGTSLREILQYRIGKGLFAGESPEAYIEERMKWVSSGKRAVKLQKLTDGRTIEICHQPMAGGGWLTTHEDITAGVEADATLRKRDELFTKAFQACPAAFAISTPVEGRLYDVNDAFLSTLGYDLDEVKGKSSHQLGIWVDKAQRRRFIDLVLKNGSVRDFYGKWVTKSGKQIEVLVAGELFEFEGETRLLSLAQDITERSRTLDILRATIANFPGGISIFDGNLNLLMANQQFYEMLGFPQDRLAVGANLEAFFRFNAERGEYGPGDIEQQVRERMELAWKFEAHHFERERPDGTILEVRGFPIPEGGFVTSYVDITERKKADADLKKSEELFVKAFHAVPAMFAISDPETGKHYDVNDAWVATLGYSRHDASEKSVLDLGVWESQEERQHFVKLLKAQGSVRGYEARMRAKDGRMLDVVIAGEYVTVRGEPRMFVVSQDVTHQKRADALLRGQKDNLQRRVEQATAELKVKATELEAALSKEKELNEMQRQFVSMASHEFRTPLAVIDSSVQRLMRHKDKLSPEMLESRVLRIRSAVQIMSALMESTLSAASMDSGRMQLSVRDCDLRELVKAVCRRQIDIGTGHAVLMDVNGLPERIRGDETALGQVFTNLLSNAIKYSPDVKEISVRGWSEDGMACISVTDKGLGIDEEDMPQMFTRFFRARTSTGIPGTGIGLSIVKMLVEMHGGTITVESKKGEGSCFTVRLPVDGPGSARDGEHRAA
ncbi:MAG: PAS domain S-box protein [Hyphomicrobiales bacterium]